MSINIDLSALDLMDALDLAILIEFEAFERYTLFAKQIGNRYPHDAGFIFQNMAVNEEKHGRQLSERRQAMFGDTPPRVSSTAIFDVEAPDSGAPRWNMSPLKAFELALDSEEKAFLFFNEALEHVKDPDVRTLFEELREEEAEHVSMVKEAMAKLPPGSDVDLENEDD